MGVWNDLIIFACRYSFANGSVFLYMGLLGIGVLWRRQQILERERERGGRWVCIAESEEVWCKDRTSQSEESLGWLLEFLGE